MICFQLSTKVLLELYEKISSKHIEVRSCFDLSVGGNAMVQSDFNWL
jgi:hypothetical protein